MRYTAKYFKESMPEWKRKKDPILSRVFYRRVSFGLAAVLANMKVSANAVSYFSALIGIIACACFLPCSWIVHVVGAILINLWLVLDCTDGNLARSVKSQPFGEFADGISSYILVAFMCSAMGVTVYQEGGLLIQSGNFWIIYFGALASTADTLMRLIYQKYKATEREMSDKGILEIEKDIRTDHSQVGSLRVRIEAELGIGGLLPIAILVASVLKVLDVIVVYCLIYYGISFLLATMIYVRKAIIKTKGYEE